MIQRPQLRGAEIFACQLSSELGRLGTVSDVVCLFGGTNRLFPRFPELVFRSIGASTRFRAFDVAAYRRLNETIRKGNYDIVQANAGDTLKYAVLSKSIYRWPQPLVYRNANFMSRFFRGPLHRRLNTWLLKRCDHVISVSETCRRDLVNLCPSTRSRSVTIPIGTTLFDDVAPVARTLPGPLFISVAGFVPEKNHRFLIRVFAEFVRRHGSGQLWLVGDGPLRSGIEREVGELSLGDRVTFFGAVSEPMPLLKASDALLLPSRIEGLPGVILEALACGVPVIASNAGGIQDVIEDGRSGFCIDGFDIGAYVAKMEEVLRSGVRRALAANGRGLIEDQYLLPGIAQRFQATYANIIGNGN